MTIRIKLISRLVRFLFVLTIGLHQIFAAEIGTQTYTEKSIRRALKVSSNLKNEFFFAQYHYWRLIHLQMYPFKEIFINLANFIDRTTRECRGRMKNDAYVEHIMSLEWAFYTLSQMATRNELSELEMIALKAQTFIQPFDSYVANQVGRYMRHARKTIQLREGPMMTVQQALETLARGDVIRFPQTLAKDDPEASQLRPSKPKFIQIPGQTKPMLASDSAPGDSTQSLSIQEHLKRFEKLKDEIDDQDEVVEALIRNAARRFFFRQSGADLSRGIEPSDVDIFSLDGQPGTGKDTIAQAFVDAVHDRPGAHLEHLLKLPVHESTHEAWNTMGSPTGYKGSTGLSPLQRFLIFHSGGRYAIQERRAAMGGTEEIIVENPEWRPGMVLPGYESPDRGFIFVNDFHQWAKKAKDIVLLEAVEHGRWKVNNPGPGLSQPYLYVPCRIFVASNYGTGLIVARDAQGKRYGPALSFAELKAKWRRVKNNKDELKQARFREYLGSSNGNDEHARGTSEELANRLPTPNLLSPISPAGLSSITRRGLRQFSARFHNHPEMPYTLFFSESLVQFVVDYDYNPEENARPIKEKIKNLVEDPLVQAYVAGKLKQANPSETTLLVGVLQNENGTSDLILRFLDADGNVVREERQFIEASLTHLKNTPVSQSDLRRMFQIESELGDHLVGQFRVKRDLASALLLMTDRSEHKPANESEVSAAESFLLLGLSSTGKTQSAKAIARVFFGSEKALKTIDFTGIVTEQQVVEKLVGRKLSQGRYELSELLNHYDAHGGRIVVLLDEVAVSHPRVMLALLQVLREPYIEGADGERRAMSHVILALTGNTGKEWYDALPRELNEDELMVAWHDIYDQAMADEAFLRATVDKAFPEPLVNRIGMDRTYFFGPLGYKDIRELFLMTLKGAFANILAPQEGRRGWNVQFKDQESLETFIEDAEQEGFKVREQGASIVHFVNKTFAQALRTELLKAEVEPGSLVVISPSKERRSQIELRTLLNYDVHVTGRQNPLRLQINGRLHKPELIRREEDQILVGIHEAAHEVVRVALFGDRFQTKRLRNVSGATLIGGQGVHYEGIAESQTAQNVVLTRQALIHQMAVLFAGDLGQMISTEDGVHDAGKANDIQRASDLARTAILQLGLSNVWGREAAPAKMKLDDYVRSLTPERRSSFEREFASWIEEARVLAISVLIKNQETVLYPLAKLLVEEGELLAPRLNPFFQDHPVNSKITDEDLEKGRKKLEALKAISNKSLEAKLLPEVPRPTKIANLDAVSRAAKARALEGFKWPAKLPVVVEGNASDCPQTLASLGSSQSVVDNSAK